MRILLGIVCGVLGAALVKTMKEDVRCEKRIAQNGVPEYEFYSARERQESGK